MVDFQAVLADGNVLEAVALLAPVLLGLHGNDAKEAVFRCRGRIADTSWCLRRALLPQRGPPLEAPTLDKDSRAES